MEPHNHHRRSRVMHRDVHALPKRVEVVTDIVYVTASVSAGGKVVGFTTLDEPVATTPPSPTKVEPKVTTKPAPSEKPRPPTTSETPKTTEVAKTTRSTPSPTSEPTKETSPTSTFATSTSAAVSTSESILALTSAPLSTSTSISSASLVSSSASEASSETSASSAPTASSTGVPASGGLSTGATVGLAVAGVGVFLVLGFIVALVYRKKSQKKIQEAYGKPEDEKAGGGAAGAAYTSSNNNLSRADTITCEKAPRVPSLRPVTQFLPNLTVTPPGAEPASQQQPQAQLQPQPQQRAPMAAASPVGLTRSESRKAPPPALVFTKSQEEVPSAPVSAATTANSVAPLLAKTQTSSIASSSSAEYTDGGSSVAGTPVTSGPAGAVNTSPVHRVQMDFKPSMEDELGLRVGQLVRLLYEYDDGWALCIRLDRSQQGVCPRTCLSQRPVKPRPQGSPRPGNSPNGRPQSPAGSQGLPRPYSPANGPRAQSPGLNGGQFPQSPVQMRPQSPAQAPPQSPAGYVKQVYRPATPTQQAQLRIIPAGPVQRPQSTQSPITQSPIAQSPVAQSPVALRAGPSQVTVTTTTPAVIPEAAPPTPASPGHEPQSPSGSLTRPAVAPVRPSPLSNEQTSDQRPEPTQPVFHAM